MANEKRMIDANELLEAIERIFLGHYAMSYKQSVHDFYNAVMIRIKRCPTVDAVEVVRCEDCKNWNRETVSCEMNSYLAVRERPCWYEEDFCSYGERRTDDRT